MHSQFSQVEMSLGDTLVTPSTNLYPYRAIFETLLNYGRDSKESMLTSELFYKDTAGQMNAIETDSTKDNNIGWNKRRAFSDEGNVFEMFGRLHLDLFNSSEMQFYYNFSRLK